METSGGYTSILVTHVTSSDNTWESGEKSFDKLYTIWERREKMSSKVMLFQLPSQEEDASVVANADRILLKLTLFCHEL